MSVDNIIEIAMIRFYELNKTNVVLNNEFYGAIYEKNNCVWNILSRDDVVKYFKSSIIHIFHHIEKIHKKKAETKKQKYKTVHGTCTATLACYINKFVNDDEFANIINTKCIFPSSSNVVDLKTGITWMRKKEDLMTFKNNVVYLGNLTCTFDNFMKMVLRDIKTIFRLQNIFGYFLTNESNYGKNIVISANENNLEWAHFFVNNLNKCFDNKNKIIEKQSYSYLIYEKSTNAYSHDSKTIIFKNDNNDFPCDIHIKLSLLDSKQISHFYENEKNDIQFFSWCVNGAINYYKNNSL